MRTAVFSLFIILSFVCTGQLAAQNFVIPLYPDGQVPNYQDVGEKEIRDSANIVRVSKVQVPGIEVYLPSKRNSTGKAVVICPGGGYGVLAYDWEGSDIAKMFNTNGIAAIVLKYRLPASAANIVSHLSPLMDAQRAMRMVRHNAVKWNIDPTQVGIMGFSAGGHLASTLSTHFDCGNAEGSDPVESQSCRPDFSILIYPVVSSDPEIWHRGSFRNLIGEDTDSELLNYYSNEKQITPETPPAILIHSSDDTAVPVQNSIRYYEGLLKHSIPAEMHIYPYGGHGYSLAIGRGHLATWPDRVIEWLKSFDEQ